MELHYQEELRHHGPSSLEEVEGHIEDQIWIKIPGTNKQVVEGLACREEEKAEEREREAHQAHKGSLRPPRCNRH